jgi:DeoR/GlpR family transcriptional regulator of sugar metabolism
MNALSPRQEKILELVHKKGSVPVGEIQQIMRISQATAYREIQTLIQIGAVTKIPGGIRRVEGKPARCLQCGGELNARLSFLIEKKDGTQLNACCAHCGLMAINLLSDIHTAMTADFIYGTMINVRQAWYVLHDEIGICCTPSVLCFSKQEDAKRFVKGFGGSLVNFVAVQRMIKEKMSF